MEACIALIALVTATIHTGRQHFIISGPTLHAKCTLRNPANKDPFRNGDRQPPSLIINVISRPCPGLRLAGADPRPSSILPLNF